MWVLVAGMSVVESTGSAEVTVLVGGPLEQEYRDWLCCWSGCADTDYDSVAASEEAAGSSWWVEECDAPSGSGKLHCQTLEERGSFVNPEAAAEPC